MVDVNSPITVDLRRLVTILSKLFNYSPSIGGGNLPHNPRGTRGMGRKSPPSGDADRINTHTRVSGVTYYYFRCSLHDLVVCFIGQTIDCVIVRVEVLNKEWCMRSCYTINYNKTGRIKFNFKKN